MNGSTHGAAHLSTGRSDPVPDHPRRIPAQAGSRVEESRFHHLLRTVPTPVVLVGSGGDDLGSCLEVNPSMGRLTGHSEERLRTMSLMDLIASDGSSSDLLQQLATVQGDQVSVGPLEQRWIHADGHLLWVRITLDPGPTTGEGASVVVQVEDIAGRVNAHGGAHHILQSFPHGAIVVFDHELRFVSAGGLGLAEVGLSRTSLEGRTIFEVFPAAITSVIEPLYRAALDGSESDCDVPFEGRIFSQRLGPVRDADGVIVAGIGFTQDITESRRLQVAFQESRDRLAAVIEYAPIGLAIISLDQRYLMVNPAFCHITGYRSDQLLQSPVSDFAAPIQTAADAVGIAQLVRGEVNSAIADIRIQAADGTIRWVSRSMSMLRGTDGSPLEYIVQIKDISDRKLIEHTLSERTRRLRDAETIGHSGSWELAIATGKVTWSDGLFAIYGIDPLTFGADYASAEQFMHPDDRAPVRAAFDACGEFGTAYTIRYRITRPDDGSLRWCEARAERRLTDGHPTHVGGSVVDVTDLVLAEDEMRTAYTFQQAVMDASPDLIFAYQPSTRAVVWSNRSLAGVLGFSDPGTSGPGALRTGAAPVSAGEQAFGDALLAALDTVGDDTAQLNIRLEDAAAEHRWFSLRTTPLHRDARGEVTELLGILRDVTEAMVSEKHLEHTALHDSLTGLPNRALLIDRIEGALVRSGRDHREISVLFCDLDGFKRVNDTAGHAAGDAVLIETAHRLQQVLREGDTVARVGGDEFIVLIEPWNRTAGEDSDHRDDDQIAAQDRALAPRIAARITQAIREPVVINGVEHLVTASIGITYGSMSHAGDLRTASADDMVQDADAAMYKAKSRGKDRYEVFEQSMRASLQERSRVERLLRLVLKAPVSAVATVTDPVAGTARRHARMSAAYQPIFDSVTHRLVGFEALARLVDADGVNVPPDVFIAVAEEIGVIHQLGLMILDLACGQLAAWRADHPAMAAITMAVNVSAIQAADTDLGEDVHRALTSHSLQPEALILELTETALLQAAHSTIVNLRILHDEGIGIAIDDFGVGYASLRYLATLPVSALKIDRSFTAGLPHDTVSRKIVTAVAGLAADLDLTCIVEGVETDEQLRALPHGVELQGYLTGRPLPPHLIDVGHLMTHGAPTC